MYCSTAAHLKCSVGIIKSRPGYSPWASCLSFSVSPPLRCKGGVKSSTAFIDLYVWAVASFAAGQDSLCCKQKKKIKQVPGGLHPFLKKMLKVKAN